MDSEFILNGALLIAVTGISAYTDVLKRRIYNKVLAPGFIAAAILHLLYRPVLSAETAVYAFSFISILFICFILGLIGGGDVKLYAFLLFLYPEAEGLKTAVLSVMFSGIAAVIKMSAAAGKTITAGAFAGKSAWAECRGEIFKKGTMPMGLYIFLAAVTEFTAEGINIWKE